MSTLWELREEVVRNDSVAEHHMRMEYLMEGGRDNPPLLLGLYSSDAMARAALSMRLQPLFGGADCFSAPCHEKLEMQQRWEADGSGKVVVSEKKLPRAERVLPDTTQSDEKLVLTVASSHMVVDQPPRADRRRACDDSSWDLLLYLVRPPPPPLTAEELAAQKAMLLEQKQRVRERNARFFQA
jgi:hypothetical protein